MNFNGYFKSVNLMLYIANLSMYFVSAIVGLAGKENHLSHYPWTKDKQAVSNILLYTQIKNLFSF